jgi:DNA-binding response OmpR family regulator
MLPSRAYANSVPPLSPGGPITGTAMLVVASPADALRFAMSSFSCVPAHTTADALRALERTRPRVTAIDWDHPGVDGAAICRRVNELRCGSVLVISASPDWAPAALKAGCHAFLLRPFARNLLAGRVGRLSREPVPSALTPRSPVGTNRVWPETSCPRCNTDGAVSFEFHSHRRMWYACLACDRVWLGARQE